MLVRFCPVLPTLMPVGKPTHPIFFRVGSWPYPETLYKAGKACQRKILLLAHSTVTKSFCEYNPILDKLPMKQIVMTTIDLYQTVVHSGRMLDPLTEY